MLYWLWCADCAFAGCRPAIYTAGVPLSHVVTSPVPPATLVAHARRDFTGDSICSELQSWQMFSEPQQNMEGYLSHEPLYKRRAAEHAINKNKTD